MTNNPYCYRDHAGLPVSNNPYARAGLCPCGRQFADCTGAAGLFERAKVEEEKQAELQRLVAEAVANLPPHSLQVPPAGVEVRPLVAGVGPDAPIVTNEKGAKQSASLYRADLLPPLATLRVAAVLKHGADKYGPNNWRGIPVADHVNHAMIHVLAHNAGDTSDDHLEHAACRLLMALEVSLAPGPAAG